MKFRDFLQEDANSQETGLFANVQAKDTGHRVPSDGQPFAQYLNIASGAKPSQGGGGFPASGGAGAGGMGGMFMKNFMKRMMLKKMKKN